MATAHWSRDKYTLWWRDAGSKRMRVSFHADPAVLREKCKRLYHDDIDAALYSADGARLPLSGPAEDRPKKARKPRKRKQEHAAEDVDAGTVEV